MAYVIAICGAGGKTTLIFEKAKYYLNLNKSVAITTTTKMWYENEVKDINSLNDIKKGNYYIVANSRDNHIVSLNKNDFDTLCKKFDVVLIEADGSRSMPIKIPDIYKEPVIPENVNEIIVVYGLQSLTRKLGVVCHRFNLLQYVKDRLNNKNIDYDTVVDIDLINDFYENFYEKPLKKRYPNVKIDLHIVDITLNENYKNYKKIAFVISASGFSKRFNDNKLLYKINNIPLYKIVVDEVLKAKINLQKKIYEKYLYNIDIDIAVVSQYESILNDDEYTKKLFMIKNDKANLGQSYSIKLATKKFIEYDAICYFNADTPFIDYKEIVNMVFYYICSNDSIGVMVVNSVRKNPAIFYKSWYDKIMHINGDVGLKQIILENERSIYKYFVDEKILYDIDCKEDLHKYNLIKGDNNK